MDTIPTKPLLPPQIEDGNPLMDILRKRSSAREFDPRPLPEQVLSNLLWAAFGVNRPEAGMRTAPSACNWQEIDVYVATAGGLFLYHAPDHSLEMIAGEDVRALTGVQDFVPVAPVNLIYVADTTRINQIPAAAATLHMANDTGFIGENVYLFCAAEGLATVVRAMIDRDALAAAMRLRDTQRIQLAQTVGYPAAA
jgi:nitroreductase